MLDQALKTQVTTVFKELKQNYTFHINIASSHTKREELIGFLKEVASCSNKIHYKINTDEGFSFSIVKGDEKKSNIVFKTVPTGHEFTSLLLAILNMDGIGKNLPDDIIIERIKALKGKITIKSYISLSCTNCPDVVQTLNLLAIYNTNITHEIIDGAIHQEEVDNLNVQAVPSVYANGELLHVGRSSLGELLEKLEKQVGTNHNTSTASATKKAYDMIVVGGGPAGVSSAVYSARKGFSVAIIAEQIGGQVTETVAIENMISIPKTTGSELASNLKLHLNDYPITILENRTVDTFEVTDGIKTIYTSLGEVLTSPAVIIATGASWRKLNVPGENDYIGSGVAFCTHCDGPFYKDKTVVVVGGGNSGLEAAIDLSSIATKVTVLEYMDQVKGDEVLQKKLKTLSNVTVITSAETIQVIGDGNKVTAIQFKHRKSGELEELITDGIFVQIGLTANSQVFKDIVKTNKIGEIEIDIHCRTKIPGVYAAGDVSIVPYKQIIIAMGEGSKAALSAFEDNIKEAQLS